MSTSTDTAPAWAAGDLAVWLHCPRGGYGYVFHVDVQVAKVSPQRVLIEAPLRKGRTKLVWVRPRGGGAFADVRCTGCWRASRQAVEVREESVRVGDEEDGDLPF